jgi:hypothetical protein
VLRASQDQFEKANNSLISRIKELEFKLVTRESRPEDLERITQLEKEVAEKVSFTIAICACTLHMHEAKTALLFCSLKSIFRLCGFNLVRLMLVIGRL